MATIKYSSEKTIVDENGKVKKRIENITKSWNSEPDFVKVYLQDVLYLSDMPTKHAAITYELLRRTTYADQKMEVVINAYVKKTIQEKLGLKGIGGVNNAITDLVRGQIIFRLARGVYRFNPYYFGKGDWRDIARLRLEIHYNQDTGRTFKNVCEYYTMKEKEKKTKSGAI